MLEHERAWLDYCRRVVRDDDHRVACALRGGSAAESPPVFADVRWPGYLGADYRPGGLLWVNIIHEDLGQPGFRDGAASLAAATGPGGTPTRPTSKRTRPTSPSSARATWVD